MSAHWALDYLGQRWTATGTELESWNCWTLFRHIQLVHYGLEVPDLSLKTARHLRACVAAGRQAVLLPGWEPADVPEEGCAVAMSKGAKGDLHHVGVWTSVDGGRVVHCLETVGVVAQPVSVVRSQWATVEYRVWRP